DVATRAARRPRSGDGTGRVGGGASAAAAGRSAPSVLRSNPAGARLSVRPRNPNRRNFANCGGREAPLASTLPCVEMTIVQRSRIRPASFLADAPADAWGLDCLYGAGRCCVLLHEANATSKWNIFYQGDDVKASCLFSAPRLEMFGHPELILA